jgi:hypothetical protein
MLNADPKEDEIPLERADLTLETQIIFDLYDKLPSRWEGFSGQYLGKDLVLLPILLNEFKVELSIRKYAWDIIPVIDNFMAKDIASKIKRKGELPSGN